MKPAAFVADPFPIQLVVIQPSPFCNLDCTYCYLPDRTNNRRLSFETLRLILNRLFESPRLGPQITIVWHAGEPLSVPISFYDEAFRLVTRANPGSIKVTHSFQTNATLIDAAWCEFFRRNGVRLGVSLDGPRGLHDIHRRDRNGRGAFDRTMQGVRLLQGNGIPFHVIAVLTHDALSHADEVWNFLMDNGIRRFGFNVEQAEGIHRSSSLNTLDATPMFRSFLARLMGLWSVHPDRARIAVREFDSMQAKMISGCFTRSAENTPLAILNFDYEGNMSTFSPELLAMRDSRGTRFLFGHVQTHRVEDMLADPTFLRVNSGIQAGIRRCRESCEYFELCGGGAPGNKLAESGRFDVTETLACRLRIKETANVVLEHLENANGIP